MDLKNLASLRQYLTVAEHKAGTLKLKVKASILTDPVAKNCMEEFKNTPQPQAILDTKFNLFTQTVTIKYDTSSIAPQDIDEILSTQNDARFLALAETYYNKLLA